MLQLRGGNRFIRQCLENERDDREQIQDLKMFPRMAPPPPPPSLPPQPPQPPPSSLLPSTPQPFLGIHSSLMAPCDPSTSGQEVMTHLPPFFPHMRFPFFIPRLPPDVPSSQMMFPPVPVRAPAHTFFTLADLDLCLYGNTSWLTSTTSSNTGKPRPYVFSGIRISQHLNALDPMMSTITGEVVPATHGSSWRSSKSVPPVHDLPTGLVLSQTSFAGVTHYAVFCGTQPFAKGTRFGPFKGRVVNPSEMKTFDDNGYMWEIFKDGRLSHFLDGRGSAGNWMSYVNCARTSMEQNLIAVQDGEFIYYETCCEILPGTELLVWYSETYDQFMGIPLGLQGVKAKDLSAQGEQECGTGYQCEHCGKVFTYKYYKDKHLKYTKCVDQGDRKFPCQLCNRSFEKKDRLRIHVLHVHEKHRPHKCVVCAKSFSQSSSLNKHMRVHSGERPYKCVYCNKSFTASSILRTHIRQHSGERPFKCKFCGKAFASHAAHDSHVRRTHARDKRLACEICGLECVNEYDLQRHALSHMEGFLGSNFQTDGTEAKSATTWDDVTMMTGPIA